MTRRRPTIELTDPQGAEALDLLRHAALEVRALYDGTDSTTAVRADGPPVAHSTAKIGTAGPFDGSVAVKSPLPTNAPTPPRGAYFLARLDGVAAGMGAHHPIDATISEVRRIYVLPAYRRCGIARALLAAVERHARAEGFTRLRLETGERQQAALRLYPACGYTRIPPFGLYVSDATSVCFEKLLVAVRSD